MLRIALVACGRASRASGHARAPSFRSCSATPPARCLYVGGAFAGAVLVTTPPALAQPPTLDTVVVTASRTPTRVADTLADVTVLDRDDIVRAPQSTLIELLGAQPGLEFTQNGGMGQVSGVFIRGASSGGTLVLVDGVRMGSATVGTTALEQIPLEQVDSSRSRSNRSNAWRSCAALRRASTAPTRWAA